MAEEFERCRVELFILADRVNGCYREHRVAELGRIMDDVERYLQSLPEGVISELRKADLGHAGTDGKGIVNEVVREYLRKKSAAAPMRSILSDDEDDDIPPWEWGRRK